MIVNTCNEDFITSKGYSVAQRREVLSGTVSTVSCRG